MPRRPSNAASSGAPRLDRARSASALLGSPRSASVATVGARPRTTSAGKRPAQRRKTNELQATAQMLRRMRESA
jgi:hypothetical protein